MGTPGYSDLGATNGTSAANKKQPFWKRNKNSSPATHDAELGAAGASAYIAEEKHRHNNARASHETGVTGTTAASPTAAYGGSSGNYQNGVAEMTAPTTAYQPYHQGAATGGYSQPATTAEYPSTFGHGNYQTA